jgi:hypothetical protein
LIQTDEWKIISHRFDIETYDEDKIYQIKISAFNSFGDKKTITINYSVIFKTLYELGTEMFLYSANTTNVNKVSYTLKQRNTDSIIVLNTLDWREKLDIKELEEEIVTVSDDFSNEFVNEDATVWDWNNLPTISKWKNEFSADKTTVTCSFEVDETKILIDEWTPVLEKLVDGGNTKYTIESMNINDALYSFVCSVDESDSSSDNARSVYVAYVNPLVGVNGASGFSEKYYFLNNSNDDWRPKHLVIEENEIGEYFTIDKNDLKIRFRPSKGYPLCSLSKAEMMM